jgi:hypothetical protein
MDNEHEDGWEEVEGEESAENGASEIQAEAADLENADAPSQTEARNTSTEREVVEEKARIQLPDVPTGEPGNEGPATKKQKSEV